MSKKSSLMTPDPYHTPGYCGYVPQFKYQSGSTFGSHTHSLLTSSDPVVASSGHPVLSDTMPLAGVVQSTGPQTVSPPLYQTRTKGHGDQKHVPQMVPGYTGYIPKNLHNFGHSYANNCHAAFTSFEQDQAKHRRAMMQDTYTDTTGSPLDQQSTPLCATSTRAKPYLSIYTRNSTRLEKTAEKHCMSGYTGFVPKARKYLGQSYPIIAKKALQENAAERHRLAKSWNEPVQLLRRDGRGKRVRSYSTGTTGLYTNPTGLLPHYTGHVPGEKFKYGNTFGALTKGTVPELLV